MKMLLIKLFTFMLAVCTLLTILTACNDTPATNAEKRTDTDVTTKTLEGDESNGVVQDNPIPEKPATDGLEFALINNDTEYGVKSIGQATETHIIIPQAYNGKPVTRILTDAFERCESLESIELPDTIEAIEESAFAYCRNMSSIILSNNLDFIGTSAFYNCIALTYTEYKNGEYLGNANNPYICLVDVIDTSSTEFQFSDKTKIIYCDAFDNCSFLKNLLFPQSIVNVGSRAFWECTELTAVKFDNCATNIGHRAFENCKKLTQIELGNSITAIESYAFSDCSELIQITIPKSVSQIEAAAFEGCRKLESVVLHDDIIRIGASAFQYCGIKNIVLPEKITVIDFKTFAGSKIENITLGKNIAEIGRDAFYDCNSLSNITYLGTKAEWAAIEKANQWSLYAGDYIVTCSDGIYTEE